MELLKLENFADALLDKYETKPLNESLTESFVKEWWGQIDEDPRDVAAEYGLDVKALSRSGDETLYKFEGTVEAFRDAMDDGYFYSMQFGEDEGHSEDLDESCEGSINECSVFSLNEKEELTETVARSPRYELEDLGNLIEDAKAALEDKDMENMYLFGHTIYDFIEENKNELNDVVIDELGNLQDELEAEAQKLDESCNKNLKEGFSDDLFNRAVNIVKEFIHDTFDSGDIPSVEEVETQVKENMGEFNGLVGDQAEVIDVAATYFDLPSIIDAAIEELKENGFFGIMESVEEPKKVLKFHYKGETDPLQIDHLVKTFGELPKVGWYTEEEWNALPSVDSQYGYLQWDDLIQEFDAEDEDYRNQFFEMRPIEEDKSDLNERVEDVYWYSNSDFKEDLTWLTNDLTDHFFKEMESAYWGISKKDVTNVFNTALNSVLNKMRESDDCTLFEDCNKEEISEDVDVASARPNHMKILDAIDNGYIDYQMVAEELLRWMPDDKLADFVSMYIDYEDDLDEAIDARPNHTTILDMLESGALDYKETAEELLRWIPDDKLADFISLYVDPMFDELEESVEEIKPTHRGRKLHSEE